MRYGITLGRTFYSTVNKKWNLFEVQQSKQYGNMFYAYVFGKTDIWFSSPETLSKFITDYNLVVDDDEVVIWKV